MNEYPKFKYRTSDGVDAVMVQNADEEAALGAGHFDTPDEARAAKASEQAPAAAPTRRAAKAAE